MAYSEAVLGSSQAVLWIQLNFSSAPEVYMIKHMPPLRSAWEREVSSDERADEPTLKRPNPKMMAFNTIRMSKLVKLSVRTSEVEDARAKSSDVNSTKGATILFYMLKEIKDLKLVIGFTNVFVLPFSCQKVLMFKGSCQNENEVAIQLSTYSLCLENTSRYQYLKAYQVQMQVAYMPKYV